MHTIVKGNIETIDQLSEFIEKLSEQDYQYTGSSLFESSIGQHLRHILDLYMAMMHPLQNGLIDYDVRRRGIPLETDKSVGLLELQQTRNWLETLTEQTLFEPIEVKSEVMLSSTQSIQVTSTLGRELCFTSSHLVHHLAIMAAIARLIGHQVDSAIGQAPTTASFNRSQQA
ncbi:DinB family protein [Pelagibaculum spongiae]|uniref:DinB family protein n=1 Tax=Pelagibaculum spongiae TaxID=2080658 RepID=A0A2V1GVH5_9GAMM|nr:DinB family protein [Pelagibaculum spongiae]PVZ69691.1 DinB family protein [Pelagibaculum spongiae]